VNNFIPDIRLLANGVAIHFARNDNGDGTPVIFLHGYADSWMSFKQVLVELPRGICSIAMDLRGHGDSDKPASGYHMKDLTEDLVLFMDALELEKANIVGHSMGSFIAQSFAACHPRRIERLVLISSAPSAHDNAMLRELKPHIETLNDPIDRSFVRDFQTPSNPIPQEMMEMIISESMKVPAIVWRQALAGLLEVDNRPVLKNISAQTLIIWGNQDSIFTREDQEGLLSAIVDSKLVAYGAGHALHWEKPQELAADLADFLF